MSTYTPITTFSLSSSTSSVIISGIPQSYTDLVLVCNIKGNTANVGCNLQFNGDAGSNYSTTQINANGAPVTGTNRYSNQTAIFTTSNYTSGTNDWATVIWNIPSYTNTTTNKVVLARYSRATYEVSFQAGLYRSTSAISSITLNSIADSYVAGSTFNLYGISSNDSVAPKATGGNTVVSDGTYWYHAYFSSGTFTPTQAITADVLVVAGGGSGGLSGGGGGAGGLRAFTSQAFAAQNYVVTVGAGGSNSSGSPTSIGAIAVSGGGKGGANNSNGSSGGSGGGAGFAQGATYTGGSGNAGGYSPVEGYAGGNTGTADLPGLPSSGGGGAGGVGTNAASLKGGNGGAGTQTYNSINFSTWLSATSQGVSGFLAGGGGGNCYFGNVSSNEVGLGGSGGGGRGAGQDQTSGVAGRINTGSGGGGSYNSIAGIGAGGSGIVIVRYPV